MNNQHREPPTTVDQVDPNCTGFWMNRRAEPGTPPDATAINAAKRQMFFGTGHHVRWSDLAALFRGFQRIR